MRDIGRFLLMLLVVVLLSCLLAFPILYALSGVLSNVNGSVPAWLPAPQLEEGPMSRTDTVFMCLLGAAFVGVDIVFAVACMLFTAGHVRVTLDGDTLTAFLGVGPVGLKRRRRAMDFSGARIGQSSISVNERPLDAIELVGDKPFHFGSGLTKARLHWMVEVLNALLQANKLGEDRTH